MNKKNKKEIKPEVEEMDIDEASGSDEVVYEVSDLIFLGF